MFSMCHNSENVFKSLKMLLMSRMFKLDLISLIKSIQSESSIKKSDQPGIEPSSSIKSSGVIIPKMRSLGSRKSVFEPINLIFFHPCNDHFVSKILPVRRIMKSYALEVFHLTLLTSRPTQLKSWDEIFLRG